METGIEVVLAYVEYDKNSQIKNGELPIKTLLEVSAADYPVFVTIGQWTDGGKLLVQPHLKAKINEKYRNVDIAIKVIPRLSKTINKITTEPLGYGYQKYQMYNETEDENANKTENENEDQNACIYYVPPRNWERNKFNKMPQETITGHYTTVGSETIQITFYDRHRESMLLTSKFQDKENDFYRELIFDLISMHQQLCVDDSSSMSMAIKWADNLYKETEHLIKEFCNTFRLIEKDAQPELKPFQNKKSFYKIKKMSSHSLIEHEIFHKNKVTSTSYKENFDTFEHRVIKTHLKRLKNVVKVRENMEMLALENEKSRLEARLNYSEKELENKIKELHLAIKNKRNEIKNKLEQKEDIIDKSNLQTVYIQFRVLNLLQSGIGEGGILSYDIPNTKIQIKSRNNGKQITSVKNCSYKIQTNKEWGSIWKKYKSDIPGAQITQFITISIPMNCKNAVSMIFHYLSFKNCVVAENDIVGIEGDVIPNYDRGVNQKNFSIFNFEFRDIKRITVFEQRNGIVLNKEKAVYKISDLSSEEREMIIKEFHDYILL